MSVYIGKLLVIR